MNECIANDNTIKWHYTMTLLYKSKMEEMNKTKLE